MINLFFFVIGKIRNGYVCMEGVKIPSTAAHCAIRREIPSPPCPHWDISGKDFPVFV
jgi:hypothetical protein